MAKRNVIWTRTADIRFVGILEYWVKKIIHQLIQKKLLKLVSEKTKLADERPLIYKSTDIKDIRVASLGNFNFYYKVTAKELIITAFWDNRQEPKQLLKNLANK